MARVLYVWGLSTRGPGGTKASALRAAGHDVHEPTLDDMPYPRRSGRLAFHSWPARLDAVARVARRLPEALAFATSPPRFQACVRAAQNLHDKVRPEVVVGSSMGAAVALNLRTRAPLVLIAPAWRVGHLRFGAARTLPPASVLIHSLSDRLVSPAASLQLAHPCDDDRDPAARKTGAAIRRALTAEGYAVLANRLVYIGKGHACNAPCPLDRENRDPRPHQALAFAVGMLHRLAAEAPA